jgi:hypothetical protein
MTKLLLLAVPLFALTACSGGAGGDPAPTTESQQQQGLALTTYTATSIVGEYRDSVVTIALSSQESAQGIVVTEITTADLVYRLTVDYTRGTLEFVSPTTPANREQVTGLRALEDALAFLAKDSKSLTPVENTLRGAATLLSDSAAGEALPPIVQATTNRSIVNIGCGNYCRTLYGTAGYGGSSSGCTPYKQTGQNSDNCKGRCGAGCGGTRTGSSDQWTMDCAEHDYQIGPWSDCTDDVLFASTASCGTHAGCFHASNCSSADNCNNTPGANSGQCR